MNIFNKVALQGLKKNRTRTIVTIIGVVLSSAMITAVATFGVSLIQYMTDGAAQKYGDWQVAFMDVDSSFVQERTLDREVADTITFENIGYAALDGGANPNKPYLFIAGFLPETFERLPVTLLSGRLPENGSEVVVTGKVASNGGVSLAVGDTLSLAVGNRMNGNEVLGQNNPFTENETFTPRSTITYTVVGISQTPVFERDSSPGYTLITRAKTPATADNYSLFIKLEKPDKVHTYAEAVSAGHSYILNNEVLRFMGLSRNASDKIFNALLFTVGGIVIAIIMIGSIFLIYNAFSISLNERTQQIGILASVGATARQLRSSVLFEGLCISAIGIPIGVIAGLGSIWLVISVVAQKFGSLLYSGTSLSMHISIPVILFAAAVSMVTILISAYIPAKKAVNMPIMECIRQTNEVKMESKTVKTSKLSERIYGLEGVLALKNFKRNRKRYRSIVLSLVLSIVLFISTSAFVSDLKQASEQLKAVTSYDIGFGTQDMDDSDMLKLYDKLKDTVGVTDSSYETLMEYSAILRPDSLSDAYWESTDALPAQAALRLPFNILFLDDSTYLDIIAQLGLPQEEYTGPDGKMIAVAKMQDSEAEGVTDLSDLFTVPNMKVDITSIDAGPDTAPKLSLDMTFVEILPPDTPPTTTSSMDNREYFFQVLAPWSMKVTFDSLIPDGAFKIKGLIFQSDNPSRTTDEMAKVIQGEGITSAYILLNSTRMMEESRNYIFIANVFAYTFIVMISLIAVANVFNTISTNIRLRRQELAMLRSVGMSDRKFNRMMRLECFFYGMRALLVGLPLAILLSWIIYKGMFVGGADSLVYQLPLASIGISVFSVLLIIFVTMMYSVSKIKKENIIDALRDEMT